MTDRLGAIQHLPPTPIIGGDQDCAGGDSAERQTKAGRSEAQESTKNLAWGGRSICRRAYVPSCKQCS